MKIKTIDITAKEWFDKVNGNSYFSARVTLNFGMKTEKTICLPFQYGYGDHFRHMAFQELTRSAIIKDCQQNESYWSYANRKKIIMRTNKVENCLQRDVKAYGTN